MILVTFINVGTSKFSVYCSALQQTQINSGGESVDRKTTCLAQTNWALTEK